MTPDSGHKDTGSHKSAPAASLWSPAPAGTDRPTRIKICGLRCPGQACQVAASGADAIGLMLYPPSPRAVSLEQAARLAEVLDGRVSCIGVFVNPAPQWVEQVLSCVRLDGLQFHGDEDNSFCHGWGLPWLKAVTVDGRTPLAEKSDLWPDASALLFDAATADARGGTGQTFDWNAIPEDFSRPFMLAGGLTVANVSEAVQRLRPWAVDVSSGVEKTRGEKDITLVRQFVDEVRRAPI